MASTENDGLAFAGRKVWQTASDLVAVHGGRAPLYARATVALSIERGDFGGARQWRLVWRATEELLSAVPASAHGPH